MHSLLRRLPAVATAAALTAFLVLPAQAQVNTGASSSGGLDVFWSAVNGQVANPAGGTGAWVIDPADQHSNWVSPPSGSRWITGQQGWEFEAPDNTWTTYFTNFSIGSTGGYALSGNWATDNNATMWLNGVQFGSTSFTSFQSLTPFELSSGFQSGDNVLAVQVFNGSGSGNPSGVLVSDLVAVPEPMSALLLGTGLFGFGIVARRRRDEDEAATG